VNYFTGFFSENPQARNLVVRSAADGDLVWLHVHSTTCKDDRGRAIVISSASRTARSSGMGM